MTVACETEKVILDTCRLNGRGVGKPNDAYSIDHATWPKHTSSLESTKDSCDLILASKLSGGDQDTGGQMLYALPTWQDMSHYAT